MRVAVSSDHRGYQAKEKVKAVLTKCGHEVQDFGCHDASACDYPDTALPAAEGISAGQFQSGVFLCGTGIGTSIAANKVKGIRAAVCHDEVTVELARKHNDANILCLPADLLNEDLLSRMIKVWLETPFEGGRHARRLQKISDFESRNCRGG